MQMEGVKPGRKRGDEGREKGKREQRGDARGMMEEIKTNGKRAKRIRKSKSGRCEEKNGRQIEEEGKKGR